MVWLIGSQASAAGPQWHKRCNGTGYIPCHVCHGEAGNGASIHCPECHDTGKLECKRCKGSGILFTFVEIHKG